MCGTVRSFVKREMGEDESVLESFVISEEEYERCSQLVNTSPAKEAAFEEEEEEQESAEVLLPTRVSQRGRVQIQKTIDGFVIMRPTKGTRPQK